MDRGKEGERRQWVDARVKNPGRGDVEKGRQRRSWPFVVPTYYEYAPRAKAPAALLSAPF